MVFYYSIPYYFYERVSYHYARNTRTMQVLNTELVRRDEIHADLFYIKIEIDALPPVGEKLSLVVEYQVANGSVYTNKFSSLFSNHSAIDGVEVTERTKEDRKLRCIFSAQIPSIYDISSQKTLIKLPISTYINHETTFSPVVYKQDKIEIGPNEYLHMLEYDNITVYYESLHATLNVSSKRSIYPSGLPLRLGEFENQLGRVHVVDELNFTNTDPSPIGLRQSRLHIHHLRQQQFRMVHDLSISLPKAENIHVFDRVGKVATVKINQGEGMT